jgi:vacuolar protein sorting-associated protein 13A/C
LELAGLKILILNDIGNTFSPLLDFELLEIKTKLLNNNVLTTIAMQVPFRLSYYNPRASMWEPVIEPTSFLIEFYQNHFREKLGQLGETGTIITIEQNENFPFNITVSTMFIQILFKTLYLLRKMAQPKDKLKADSILDKI